MAKKDVKMTTAQNEEVIAAAVPEKELPMDNVEESFEDNAAADAAIMMPQAKNRVSLEKLTAPESPFATHGNSRSIMKKNR